MGNYRLVIGQFQWGGFAGHGRSGLASQRWIQDGADRGPGICLARLDGIEVAVLCRVAIPGISF